MGGSAVVAGGICLSFSVDWFAVFLPFSVWFFSFIAISHISRVLSSEKKSIHVCAILLNQLDHLNVRRVLCKFADHRLQVYCFSPFNLGSRERNTL
jgi:hypothetical protein